MALNVVILAAGQGKRMHSALPKVLHLLAGKPLLEHVLAAAQTLAPTRICVVYGHGGEQVRDAFAGRDIAFAKQEPQLGTGHALRQALPYLDHRADTLVLYGDVPLTAPATLAGLIAGRGERVSVLTARPQDPTGYGRIERAADGAITGIVEHKDANDAQRRLREINTGIMLLPGARLSGWLERLCNDNAQREYYLTDVIKLALADGVPVTACAVDDADEVIGINSKQQLAQLERVCQARTAARLLDAGVALADPARIDVRGELQCGDDVSIDVNCVFEGRVTLAAGVSIGPNCVLRDTTIGSASRIEPFSMIDSAHVGERCRIGPYARIRPGTTLAADVHIGNFVEVKAARIGSGSKANHLAYLGDAVIGSNVNVGAGTITCNYDGANKHQTIIEDDVFIGSDTQLVAPVTVRRGATIGAGSTITRETPAGGLTLSRAKQASISGWQRPQKQVKKT